MNNDPKDTSTPRVSRYRIKYKSMGFKRLEVLVHPEDEAALKQKADSLLEARLQKKANRERNKRKPK